MGNSSIVSVTVSTTPTTLTVSVSPTSGTTPLTVTVSGYLKTTAGAPVVGAQVSIIEDSTTVTTATTASDGSYSRGISFGPGVHGTFGLYTSFAGDATYVASSSSTVNVVLIATTTLTISVSPTSGNAPLTVTISGILKTTTGVAVVGRTIWLYSDSTQLNSTQTASDGSYAFSATLTAVGTYNFHTSFPGDAEYAGCEESDHAVVAGTTPPPSALPWVPIGIGLVTVTAIAGYYFFKSRG